MALEFMEFMNSHDIQMLTNGDMTELDGQLILG